MAAATSAPVVPRATLREEPSGSVSVISAISSKAFESGVSRGDAGLVPAAAGGE